MAEQDAEWEGCVFGVPLLMKVMSFNLRLSAAADGENVWPNRRELVIETIRRYGPDVLGVQECLPDQKVFLEERLADYTAVGVGRDDGREAGEHALILFRSKQFERVEDGTFWLSRTPGVAGSVGWDATLPRIATWVKLREREYGREFVMVNTHFDLAGVESRVHAAGLIREFVDTRAEGVPVVISGDFNAHSTEPAYEVLLRGEGRELCDTLLVERGEEAHQEGTFHGFTGEAQANRRIDWIVCSQEWRVASAGVDRFNQQGRYPSDHFPITAKLWLRQRPAGR